MAGKPVTTKRQEKAVQLLLDPEVKTYSEALIKAGYSPSSAREGTRLIRKSPAFLEALEKAREKRRDKARSLEDLGDRLLRQAMASEGLTAESKFTMGLKARELELKLRQAGGQEEPVNVEEERASLLRTVALLQAHAITASPRVQARMASRLLEILEEASSLSEVLRKKLEVATNPGPASDNV